VWPLWRSVALSMMSTGTGDSSRLRSVREPTITMTSPKAGSAARSSVTGPGAAALASTGWSAAM
jgi:hypothetical protein